MLPFSILSLKGLVFFLRAYTPSVLREIPIRSCRMSHKYFQINSLIRVGLFFNRI